MNNSCSFVWVTKEICACGIKQRQERGSLHQKLKQFWRVCNFRKGVSSIYFFLGRSRKNIGFSHQIVDLVFHVDILFFSKSGKHVITGEKQGKDLCKCLLYFLNRFYARSTFIQKTNKVLHEFTWSFTQSLSPRDNNWSVQFIYLTKG